MQVCAQVSGALCDFLTERRFSMFSIFDKLKKTDSASAVCGKTEYLIVGLGNPGPKYENTRHNAGFLTIAALAKAYNVKTDKLKFKAMVGDAMIAGKRCLLMQPVTFMNNSGEAVAEAMRFYKIPLENVIVIYDDISLEPGFLRIRRKGSDGGHNGIKSIIALAGGDTFPRIKLGVGKKPRPDYDLAAWVLSEFTDVERAQLDQSVANACAALPLIIDGKIDQAMNQYNS